MIDLNEMARAYVECALWAGLHWPGDGEEPVPLDGVLSADNVPLAVVDAIYAECREFAYANLADLLATGGTWSQHGHDLYLTRHHHGAGFWDRGYGPAGDRLTVAAHGMGEREIVVGDGGEVVYE